MRLEQFLNKLREDEFASADSASIAGPPIRQEPRPYYPYFDPVETEPEDDPPFIPPDPDSYETLPDDYGQPGTPTENAPLPGAPNWPDDWPMPDVDTDGDGIPDAWSIPELPPGTPPNQQWNWNPDWPWMLQPPPIIPMDGYDEQGRPIDPKTGKPYPTYAPTLVPWWLSELPQDFLEMLYRWIQETGGNWREYIERNPIDPYDPSTWPWLPTNWDFDSDPGPGILNPWWTPPRPLGPGHLPMI